MPQRGLGIKEMIGDKREDVLRLAEKYGATNVRVFGSVAREEATPNSDIDFMVDFKPGVTIFDMVGLWQDLTKLLGREVDLTTEKSLKRWVKPHALRDAVPLDVKR
jgi:hypothetical protein